ncbi:MAG: hypothetical protein WAN17_11285 [Candidatus Sulfotelmatobacter sp.]
MRLRSDEASATIAHVMGCAQGQMSQSACGNWGLAVGLEQLPALREGERGIVLVNEERKSELTVWKIA